MRVKLVGFLFLVAGLFVFTRGTGWQLGYMLGGVAIAFPGMLLVSPLRVRPFPLKLTRARKSVAERTEGPGLTEA